MNVTLDTLCAREKRWKEISEAFAFGVSTEAEAEAKLCWHIVVTS
jgi:hypothetical protein